MRLNIIYNFKRQTQREEHSEANAFIKQGHSFVFFQHANFGDPLGRLLKSLVLIKTKQMGS